MNAELLYTSAPSGLRQGSRGFCTVVSTVGMPINLASKLESLSGYRHMYPSGTTKAMKNPVGFSHWRFSLGGRMVSVLSRISDYDLDYSQRTNKLAHHIVVDAPMPPSGPAALLLEPGVMRDAWGGQCLTVPSPSLPILEVTPAVCHAWASTTGDAGWAGIVANAWLRPQSKPLFILFSVDQSPVLLSLIAEAVALLPIQQRWQATFGTYVTNLPPDVDCKVRCVIAGSDEASMASARGSVIDLTRPLGVAVDSDASQAARLGKCIGDSAINERVSPPPIETSNPRLASITPPPFKERGKFDGDKTIGHGSGQLPPDVGYGGARNTALAKLKLEKLNIRILARLLFCVACFALLMLLGIVAAGIYRRSRPIVETNGQSEKTNDFATAPPIPDDRPAEPIEAEQPTTEQLKDVIDPSPSPIAPNTPSEDEKAPETPPLAAADFKLSLQGFKLVSSDGSPIELAVGIPGATATAAVTTSRKDLPADWKNWNTHWQWEQRKPGKDWTELDEETRHTFHVTEKHVANTEIRVVATVSNENGVRLPRMESEPIRITGEATVEISLKDALNATSEKDLDDLACVLRIPRVLRDGSDAKYKVHLRKFGWDKLEVGTLRSFAGTDSKSLDDALRKLKAIVSLKLKADDRRVELRNLCLKLGQEVKQASQLEWILRSVKPTELLHGELKSFAEESKRLVEEFRKIDKDGYLDRAESVAFVSKWPLPNDMTLVDHLRTSRSFSLFWTTKNPALGHLGGQPSEILEGLLKDTEEFRMSLEGFRRMRVLTSSKADAFYVSELRRNTTSSDSPDLPVGRTKVHSFGLPIVLTFVQEESANGLSAPGSSTHNGQQSSNGQQSNNAQQSGIMGEK